MGSPARREEAKPAAGVNLHLISGRLLAKNTIWNLVGTGSPLIVAVFAIPILIHGLGKDRFGVLALAWALIGYASLFDIGLGRALTQLVAKKLGAGANDEIPGVVWTSLLLMLGVGVAGAGVFMSVSPWLVHRALRVPSGLQSEAVRAFYILSASIPVVIVTAGLRGLLEAHQQFRLITWLRIPIGVFTFIGPLLVLPFSRSLAPVVGMLALGRLVGCGAHYWLCLLVAPELRHGIELHRHLVSPLLRFGGWLTVSNVVGPLMVTLDRFVIGALLSVAAVTYYVTPFEVVTKLLLIPAAVVGVLFPAFSTSFVNNQGRAAQLYGRSVKYVLLALFPIVLLVIGLAQNGLTLWLGRDFAQHSTRVAQWLALGVFANGSAFIPFSFVQGVGRPDLTAKLHLCELPIYLLALYMLVRGRGIDGAAMAWSVRTVVDAVVLFLIARKLLPKESPLPAKTRAFLGIGFATLLFAALLQGALWKTAFLVAAILAFVILTWFVILTPEERSLAQSYR